MSKTPVTYIFLILCIVISIPGAFNPGFFELFNSEQPHEYWWQILTSPFLHGAKREPLGIMIHLSLNMILLLFCGRLTEKLLGTKRFFILTLVAWVGFILTQSLSGVWINGSSGIIWAFSPFLLIFIEWGKKDRMFKSIADQSKMLLIIMWLIVTVIMGFVPLMFNPTFSLTHTFFYGNLFHASATLVGFIMYFLWRKSISKSEYLTD